MPVGTVIVSKKNGGISMDTNNEKLEILKNKAINLRDEIKQHKNIIDNPALCRSTVDELNFFIDNIQEEMED